MVRHEAVAPDRESIFRGTLAEDFEEQATVEIAVVNPLLIVSALRDVVCQTRLHHSRSSRHV